MATKVSMPLISAGLRRHHQPALERHADPVRDAQHHGSRRWRPPSVSSANRARRPRPSATSVAFAAAGGGVEPPAEPLPPRQGTNPSPIDEQRGDEDRSRTTSPRSGLVHGTMLANGIANATSERQRSMRGRLINISTAWSTSRTRASSSARSSSRTMAVCELRPHLSDTGASSRRPHALIGNGLHPGVDKADSRESKQMLIKISTPSKGNGLAIRWSPARHRRAVRAGRQPRPEAVQRRPDWSRSRLAALEALDIASTFQFIA